MVIRWTVTADEVAAQVAELRELEKVDAEAAAIGSPELRVTVLRAIAEGAAHDAQSLAAAALVTVDEDIGGG